MPHLLKLPQNHASRDFVVGDIHFKTQELHKSLQTLGFDQSVDRLIAVGDFTDRGPGMLDGLKLLGEPWFFCVRGNHAQLLIGAYRAKPPTSSERWRKMELCLSAKNSRLRSTVAWKSAVTPVSLRSSPLGLPGR